MCHTSIRFCCVLTSAIEKKSISVTVITILQSRDVVLRNFQSLKWFMVNLVSLVNFFKNDLNSWIFRTRISNRTQNNFLYANLNQRKHQHDRWPQNLTLLTQKVFFQSNSTMSKHLPTTSYHNLKSQMNELVPCNNPTLCTVSLRNFS